MIKLHSFHTENIKFENIVFAIPERKTILEINNYVVNIFKGVIKWIYIVTIL